MKIYIAGKITGNPNYKAEFQMAEDFIRAEFSDIVLNPARLPEGMSQGDYMQICFAMIRVADYVALLPNWRESRGAKLEFSYSNYTEKKLWYLSTDPIFMEKWRNLHEP